MMIKIAFLADHTDAVPILARWFQAGSATE
jgi:hypothetical protein